MSYSLVLLFSLGFTWGTSFSIAKFAMGNQVNPLGYLFWQSLGPAILLSLICLFQKKIRSEDFSFQKIQFYGVCGLMGIALPNAIMYVSSIHLSSGLLGLIVNTSPILTYVFSMFFRIEPFQWNRFIGAFLGFIGVLNLFWPKMMFNSQWPWILLAFISPLMLSLSTIYMVKFRPKRTSSLVLSAGMLWTSFILVAPATWLTQSFHPLLSWSWTNFFILIEMILSSFGYLLFFELLRVAGPVLYSLVGCVVTLSALFWGFMLFHEIPSYSQWFSIVLLLSAIFCVSFYRKI